MKSDVNEKVVKDYMESIGFICHPFSKAEKQAGKTPDFKVYVNTQFVFYCEVKSIDKDLWAENILFNVKPGIISEGERPDPIYNRLSDDIHKAVKQFDSVNLSFEYPNVLVFVNNDKKCGFQDLIAVLTGNAYTNDLIGFPLFGKFSEGRIRDEKLKVNLFIFIDVINKKRALLFANVHKAHYEALCKWFGKTPDSLVKIGV